MTKGAKVKTVKVEETNVDTFELKSLWPQLSKVVKWLIQNQFDKAIEVMKLIICRRRYEIQRDTPHADIEEDVKKAIRSLIEDEVDETQMKEY